MTVGEVSELYDILQTVGGYVQAQDDIIKDIKDLLEQYAENLSGIMAIERERYEMDAGWITEDRTEEL